MNISAEAMHHLQSHSPELSLAPVLPLALLLQRYCYSLCLLPVSGYSWQLVSITVIPRAPGCKVDGAPAGNNSFTFSFTNRKTTYLNGGARDWHRHYRSITPAMNKKESIIFMTVIKCRLANYNIQLLRRQQHNRKKQTKESKIKS